jgi:CheY-like chemotaxis protein
LITVSAAYPGQRWNSLAWGVNRDEPVREIPLRRCPFAGWGAGVKVHGPAGQIWNLYSRCWLELVTDCPSHAVVLVVEDDIFERMGACEMFLDAGYRVLEAGNAAEALRFFETDPDIRLLFTDVSMPGMMSGADLARHVAARWPAVGIILASGRPRPDKLPARMRFHDKPYEPTAILGQAKEMMLSLG